MPFRRVQRFFREHFGLHLGRRPRFVPRRYAYRPAAVLKALDPSYLAPTAWRRDGGDVTPRDNALYAHFVANRDSHKWHHYFEIYIDLLTPYRRAGVRLLEIGVARGGSLRMWKQWFGADSTIVGIDIDPSCRAHDDPANGLHVRIGSQADRAFLGGVVREFGPFDVIIDDGSHVTSHMIASFNGLFGDGLKPGGLYLAEDTHTNYWAGWRDTPHSFVDFARGLVDAMHAHYALHEHYAPHENEIAWRRGPNELSQVTVPAITPWLDEIRFCDSIVAIRKARPRDFPVSEHR